MKMIPDYLLHSKSKAENRVFDELRGMLNGEGWYAFHSLNLPRHQTKRFGEVDFVICGPGGLFVFEIKGGRVSCKDGIWGTADANDRYSILKEPPYIQAKGALVGLLDKLDKTLLKHFVCGYGVITPDCLMEDVRSSEWDTEIWADSKDFRDLEKWFKTLVKHWSRVAARQNKPSLVCSDNIKDMVNQIRPDFETSTPLFDTVKLVENRIATLTEDQLKFVDVIEDNPRVICSGGAGTGKTFLAVELARRWSALDMKVALTCHSPWLKRYIDSFAIPEVTVAQFDALEVAARRAGVQAFDALIIDEGQDLLNFNCIKKMDTFLTGGLKNGQWCFFHDSNNQAGVLGSFDPKMLEYLKSMKPTNVPLKTNCRNTSQILNKIKSTLKVDMGYDSVGNGPEVIEKHVSDNKALGDTLKSEIKKLLSDSAFTVNEIVILSPKKFRDSSAFELRSNAFFNVSVMDSFSPGLTRSSVGFANIADFKGLESEVVFLIDMPNPGTNDKFRNVQYIGMSRARALLYVIVNESTSTSI